MNQNYDKNKETKNDFSTTVTIRESIEAHAEEPVIIVVPIGGDASEFE